MESSDWLWDLLFGGRGGGREIPEGPVVEAWSTYDMGWRLDEPAGASLSGEAEKKNKLYVVYVLNTDERFLHSLSFLLFNQILFKTFIC